MAGTLSGSQPAIARREKKFRSGSELAAQHAKCAQKPLGGGERIVQRLCAEGGRGLILKRGYWQNEQQVANEANRAISIQLGNVIDVARQQDDLNRRVMATRTLRTWFRLVTT